MYINLLDYDNCCIILGFPLASKNSRKRETVLIRKNINNFQYNYYNKNNI